MFMEVDRVEGQSSTKNRNFGSVEKLILFSPTPNLPTYCHYQKRSLYRELGSVPRARSQALGTETLCREQRVQLSAQKKPAVQT
jgi:hypothetical protein